MRKFTLLSVTIGLLILSRASVTLAQPLTRSSAQAKLADRGAYYEENKGQFAPIVRFLLRTPGLDAWVTNTGVVYDRYEQTDLDADTTLRIDRLLNPDRSLRTTHIRRTGDVVRVAFVGSNPYAQFTSGDTIPGIRNYFYGNDRSKWVTDVRCFTGFRVNDLYPSVDVAYRLDGGQLRYDLIAKPSADLSAIALRFEGAAKLLASDDHLTIRTALGDIEEAGLRAYQIVNGFREQIACSFHLLNDSTVGFSVGAHNEFASVVIDPLVYSTYLGGVGEDQANAIVVDKAHCAYVAGKTTSSGVTPFPTKPGSYQTLYNGGGDAFVSKLDPSGRILIYSTYLGGTGADAATGIALDNSGDAFIAGIATSIPTTANAYQRSNAGGSDAFISELGPNGDALLYSTFLGGGGSDGANAVALDADGNVYVTGFTQPSTVFPIPFPVSSHAFQQLPNGTESAFVTKFNSSFQIVYSTLLGGNGNSMATGIAADNQGRAYVTGGTSSAGGPPNGFPTTLGAFQTTSGGVYDAFVASLTASGSNLRYSTYLGGDQNDFANGITLDRLNNAYVTGYTYSSGAAPTGFPITSGAFQRSLNGLADVFVTKLDSLGASLIYSTYLGGFYSEIGYAIAIDSFSHACITGYSQSTGAYPNGYPVSDPAFQPQSNNGGDDFVTVLGYDGGAIAYSTYLGGSSDESGYGVACDDSGSVYVAGGTASNGGLTAGFPLMNPFQPHHGGGKFDASVSKFSALGDVFLLDRDTIYPDLCDTGFATILVRNFSWTASIMIDSIWGAQPLSVTGLRFPILVPLDSAVKIPVSYAPQHVGEDSTYAWIRFTADGVTHDTSVLVHESVGHGIRLTLPKADTIRATLCSPGIVTIPLNNIGCEAVTIVQYGLWGSNGNVFSVSGTLPVSLIPAASSEVSVAAHATQPGVYRELLTIRYLTSTGETRDTTINLVAIFTATLKMSWGTTSPIKGTICDSLAGDVTFTLAGCQDLTVTSASVSGPDAGRFRVLNSFPFTEPHDSLGRIMLALTYRVPGTYHCTLSIYAYSTDGTQRDTSFAFTATVTQGAGVRFTSSVSIIGSTCDSLIGRAIAATLACGALEIQSASISGTDSSFFELLSPVAVTVPVNDSAALLIKCIGLQPRTYTATLHLRFVGYDGISHDTTISLRAVIQPIQPKLVAMHDAIDLGSVQDCQFADTTITLKNSGCVELLIDSLQGAAQAGLSVSGITFPITLAPDSVVIVHVHYQPQGTNALSADLVFHTSAQGRSATTEVLLNAVGIKGASAVTLRDTTIDFGRVSLCSWKTALVQFLSSGCDSLTLTKMDLVPGAGFELLNAHTGLLAPGVSDSAVVRFTPPASGAFSEDLLLSTSAGERRVHLMAQGVPDSGRLEFSTLSLGFGSVTSDCDSSSDQFTVRNTTCSAIIIDSLSLLGAGSQAFTVAPEARLPLTLAIDSSLIVAATFTPYATSSFAARLIVWYHTAAGMIGDTLISLAGAGLDQASIGVTLKQHSITSGPTGLIAIPIYLYGKLDKGAAQKAGLQSARIQLAFNTDLLTPVDVQPSIAIPSNPSFQFDKQQTEITMPLPSDLEVKDTTELLVLHCRQYLTDSLATGVMLVGDQITTSRALPCFRVDLSTNQLGFSPTITCGDSLIARFIGNVSDFSIESVAPNPSTSNLHIELQRMSKSPITFQVLDALGRTVKAGMLGSTEHGFDLQDLPSGVLYLRLATAQTVRTRKVIVTR